MNYNTVFLIIFWVLGFFFGLMAFFKQPNIVFGRARVLHILIGIFFGPLEILLGGIELFAER